MRKYKNRSKYGRRRRAPPSKKQVFSHPSDAGCIKITIGKNRVVVWNNCGHDIIIAPGEGLRLAVEAVRRVDLDYGSATMIFAAPIDTPTNANGPKNEDDVEPNNYDWV